MPTQPHSPQSGWVGKVAITPKEFSAIRGKAVDRPITGNKSTAVAKFGIIRVGGKDRRGAVAAILRQNVGCGHRTFDTEHPLHIKGNSQPAYMRELVAQSHLDILDGFLWRAIKADKLL